jgi:hypothetical protein
MTSPPVVEPLAGPGTAEVDLWRPGGRELGPRPCLILVHGLTPEGKRDSRLAWTADRLARAGFLVAVPELPSLRAQHLRPDDAGVIRTTLERLTAHPHVRRGPVTIIAVSVGLGPVALALDTPSLAERVRLLLALGGYGEARELVRYFTTGAYAFGESTGRAAVDPTLAASFLARNPDLVPDPHDRAILMDVLAGRPAPGEPGPGGRASLLQNCDLGRVDVLPMPCPSRHAAPRRSPRRGTARAHALLVHGRDDPRSFSESGRLRRGAGRSRLVLVGLIGDVEGQAPAWHRLTDLLRLWSVCYELLAG